MSVGATWLPESERDSSYYIFRQLFQCRVPYLQTFSTDYINLYGFPASGDSRLDSETANELIVTMITINQMVEYYNTGITVHVVDYKDTKKIYEYISNHLNAWKFKLENSFHIKDAPIDELILLDKFASVVYPHAVTIMNSNYIDSLLANRVASVLTHSRENILAPIAPTVTTINPIIEENTRTSMADSFRNLSSTNKWR